MVRKKKINYLSNVELLRSVWQSKLTYVDWFEPQPERVSDYDFDHIGTEFVDTGLCLWLTNEHIPDDSTTTKRGGMKDWRLGKAPVPFRPFQITLDGRVIAMSHYRGGSFDPQCGQVTNRLATQFMMLTQKYGKKGNWVNYSYRDEMELSALQKLLQSGLVFDETVNDNPFAYFTTLMSHEFKKVLKAEQAVAEHRDYGLWMAGRDVGHRLDKYFEGRASA